MIHRLSKNTLLPALVLWLAGCAAGLNQPSAGTASQQEIEEDLLIVASADTYAKATELTKFLDKKGTTYKQIEPTEIDAFGAAPVIAVIAGMDEGVEVVGVAARVLNDPDEVQWLTESGNSAIYAQDNVWSEGQKVLLVAGATPWEAVDGLTYYRNQWLADLASWLKIQLTREEVYSY